MPSEEITPSVDDVASLLRARTVGDSDEYSQTEIGTFNDTTRPTGEQVEVLIEQSKQDILVAFVSGEIPEASVEAAKRAVTLRAAYLVEITYFPEQATSPAEDSPYLQLRSLADAALKGLILGAQLRDCFRADT